MVRWWMGRRGDNGRVEWEAIYTNMSLTLCFMMKKLCVSLLMTLLRQSLGNYNISPSQIEVPKSVS